jgi:hypothetical protein
MTATIPPAAASSQYALQFSDESDMLNSARKGLSYAAMLVMLAASVAVVEDAGAETHWQKNHPRRQQINHRLAKQKLPRHGS